ncbi:hypothetical protein JMJ85_20095 [Salmonella enterica subsp. diarizonae]|uniref:Uncharacterized protein n=1 Tax=Salmonella diarizonae TaxID=59204 RepID=A0A8F5N0L2_SALDZ|nr:hypothetical protein JMJ85_20095 [Salmonella enterica subsp. diarizonae]
MSRTIIYNHPLAQATSVCDDDMETTMEHLEGYIEEFNKLRKQGESVPVFFNLYGFKVGELLKVKIEGDTLYGNLLIHSEKDVIERLDDVYADISHPLAVRLWWSKLFPNTKAISESRRRCYGN